MNKKILNKINSEIKRKNISSKDIKEVKMDAKQHINDLQEKSSINLNLKLDKYIIARR